MDIKYQNLFCLKNYDDNKEYLAMSSAPVMVGILRLKCFLLFFFFVFVFVLLFLLPTMLSVNVHVFDN